jgi:CDP-diacylglycerol--glycerol-3-phosphate 3-phosphatidyltransferase
MVAIAVLFLGTGLDFLERGRGPEVGGLARLSDGLAGWATFVGICLLWVAAALTVMTGWDYFRKSLPYLRDTP